MPKPNSKSPLWMFFGYLNAESKRKKVTVCCVCKVEFPAKQSKYGYIGIANPSLACLSHNPKNKSPLWMLFGYLNAESKRKKVTVCCVCKVEFRPSKVSMALQKTNPSLKF